MRYLIASDIHGSLKYAKKLAQEIEKYQPNLTIILGDIYYHGVRNSLPGEYDTMGVASLLNSIKDKIMVIKGNCDSDVDALVSEFDFIMSAVVMLGERRLFLTHGDKYNKDNIPNLNKGDILCYGHFHIGMLDDSEDIIFLNPGSLSLPKEESAHSYIIIDENEDSIIIRLMDIDKDCEIKNIRL